MKQLLIQYTTETELYEQLKELKKEWETGGYTRLLFHVFYLFYRNYR